MLFTMHTNADVALATFNKMYIAPIVLKDCPDCYKNIECSGNIGI